MGREIHIALEKRENHTSHLKDKRTLQRFADEGRLLEGKDWFLTYMTDSLRDSLCYALYKSDKIRANKTAGSRESTLWKETTPSVVLPYLHIHAEKHINVQACTQRYK